MTANLGVLVLTAALSAASGPAGNDKAAAAGTTAPAATTAQGTENGLGELVTDRPDFTESTEVVGRGIAQLETGMSFESDGKGDARTRGYAAPEALLRIGLNRRTELRLGADGFVSETAGLDASAVQTTGGSDFELAAKVKLATEKQLGFDLAVIPIVSLPVGSAPFSSGGVDPTVKVAMARALPAGFDLSGNVNVSSVTDGDARFTQTAWSASFGHDLVKGWGGYWELYGFSAVERGGSAAWTFNTGVSHLVGPNRQFDMSVGYGLTEAAPNWFVSAGFSIRGAMRRPR
jgi:outer membrane putative beta-barrel porin/alpha-amylase